MIQTALFFILGFLTAAFIALLVAPAIWRRAVVLTRRRVEGSLPLTMDEIQAEKDRLRAEFAVSSRQLEITIKSLKDKIAAYMVRDANEREEIARLSALAIEKDSDIARADAEIEELGAKLAEQAKKEDALTTEIAALTDKIEAQASEIARLGRMYDEASFAASSRQIEMVSMEAKIDRLTEETARLRDDRKDAQRKEREAEGEAKSWSTALRDEHRKVVSLENKVASLTASLADSEERLERRQQELARLRGGKADADDGGGQAKLEERLKQLMRENRKLRASLEGEGAPNTVAAASGPADENAMLREQIGELAAEVVHLTATLEGPGSPIFKALEGASDGNGGGQPSLADRIRALREAEAGRAG